MQRMATNRSTQKRRRDSPSRDRNLEPREGSLFWRKRRIDASRRRALLKLFFGDRLIGDFLVPKVVFRVNLRFSREGALLLRGSPGGRTASG